MDAAGDGDVLVVLELEVDAELIEAGLAREVVNRVQKLRKKAGLQTGDAVDVFWALDSGAAAASSSPLWRVLDAGGPHAGYLRESLGAPPLPLADLPVGAVRIITEQLDAAGTASAGSVSLTLCRPAVAPAPALLGACGGDAELADWVLTYLLSRDPAALRREAAAAGAAGLPVRLAGKPPVRVLAGHDYFFSAAERASSSSPAAAAGR